MKIDVVVKGVVNEFNGSLTIKRNCKIEIDILAGSMSVTHRSGEFYRIDMPGNYQCIARFLLDRPSPSGVVEYGHSEVIYAESQEDAQVKFTESITKNKSLPFRADKMFVTRHF